MRDAAIRRQLFIAAAFLSNAMWAGGPAQPSGSNQGTEARPALSAMEALTAWNGDMPFEAQGRIAIGPGPSRAMEGSYHLVRRDARTWRETIQLPNYRREIVARDGTSWVEQQGEYQPIRVFDMDELLDFTARHRETAAGTLRRDKLGKGKNALRCFEFLCDKRTREICIDPQSGILRDETYALRIRDFTGETKIHYDNFAVFGAGQFPHSLTMTRNGKPVVTLTIDDLRPLDSASVPSESFSPNRGERRRVDCVRTRPSWEIDRTMHYRRLAPRGSFVSRVLVDARGSVREIDVLRGSLPTVEEDLVQVRWQPGTCDGVPVDSVARYEVQVHGGTQSADDPFR